MTIDPATVTCPVPHATTQTVLLGHGSGGRLSADLLHDVLVPALGPASVSGVPEDAALLDIGSAALAFSTDSFVVSPLFFPGGDIGSLAVHGTVNDLAMMGAVPVALAVAYIVEEGLPLDTLRRVAESVGAAACRAGVPVVTGDTKVVGRGAADGLFLTTTGLGRRLPNAQISAAFARPGDVVLLSGPIGAHGTTILSARESLGFEAETVSDTRPLNGVVAALLHAVGRDVHVMRDPTRGGVASVLNEIAVASGVGVEIDEAAVPVPQAVASACELLGLDPLHVANEGCFLAVVAPDRADAALAALRSRPEGADAVRLGQIRSSRPGRVVMRTLVGGERVVDMLIGEQLPRIC